MYEEAETGETQTQAKDENSFTRTRKGGWTVLRTPEPALPTFTSLFCCFRCSVSGVLLQQPEDAHTKVKNMQPVFFCYRKLSLNTLTTKLSHCNTSANCISPKTARVYNHCFSLTLHCCPANLRTMRLCSRLGVPHRTFLS